MRGGGASRTHFGRRCCARGSAGRSVAAVSCVVALAASGCFSHQVLFRVRDATRTGIRRVLPDGTKRALIEPTDGRRGLLVSAAPGAPVEGDPTALPEPRLLVLRTGRSVAITTPAFARCEDCVPVWLVTDDEGVSTRMVLEGPAEETISGQLSPGQEVSFPFELIHMSDGMRAMAGSLPQDAVIPAAGGGEPIAVMTMELVTSTNELEWVRERRTWSPGIVSGAGGLVALTGLIWGIVEAETGDPVAGGYVGWSLLGAGLLAIGLDFLLWRLLRFEDVIYPAPET